MEIMTREEMLMQLNALKHISDPMSRTTIALDMAIKELGINELRDATPDERESVNNYIKSISKPTGIDFDEAINFGK
jgi:hypothetical protein